MAKENEGSTALETIRTDLEKALPKFQEVAARHIKPERMIRILLSACSRNPKLLECSRESVLTFCLKCHETGLEPIGAGGAWPIPFANKKTGKTEMQFIADYRGLVNCAKRAGCITDAYAEVVKEGDAFDYTLGMEPTLTHKPAATDRGKPINAYCVFTLADGTKRFVVMDKDEIAGIRKRSKASDSGPWVTDETEMWKKTVVRRAMKPFAGMSPELDAAIAADNEGAGLVLGKEPVRMPTKKVIEGEITSEKTEPATGVSETGKAPADAADEDPAKAEKASKVKSLEGFAGSKKIAFGKACQTLEIDIASWRDQPLEKVDELFGLMMAAVGK